jgi:hypothetical protein
MRPIRQANYRLEDAYSSFYYILDLWWGGEEFGFKNRSNFIILFIQILPPNPTSLYNSLF